MLVLDLKKETGMLDLTKAAPNFETIRGVLNWEPSPVHSNSLTDGFDLDIFAFVLDASEKISGGSDVVFFNNKNYGNGAVTVPVDNRTGEGNDDEYIDLVLGNIPANKTKVDIYVFIHDAITRKQSFGMMANSNFVLSDVKNAKDIVKYNLSDFTNETAVHIGSFVRGSGSTWNFAPAGVAAVAEPNDVVSAYL